MEITAPLIVDGLGKSESRSPWRDVVSAVLWLTFAQALQIGFAFATGIIIAVIVKLLGSELSSVELARHPLVAFSTVIFFQISLLVIGLRKGRRTGDGNLKLGLGIAPLRRPVLLTSLAILTLPCVIVPLAILSAAGQSWPKMQASSFASTTWLVGCLVFLSLCILAPIAEEIFFRGWLWTSLSRRWPQRWVWITTSLLWMAVHMTDYLFKPVVLIPLAVSLCVARRFCGGVFAGMIVHATYNSCLLIVAAVSSFWI